MLPPFVPEECRRLFKNISKQVEVIFFDLPTFYSALKLRYQVQVIKQFEQTGSHANRYDVTILVNGLPLVQVELKKRGVAIREAGV